MERKFRYRGNALRLATKGATLLLASSFVLGCGADDFTTGTDPRIRFASSIAASPAGCGTVVVNNQNVQTYNVSTTWQVPGGTWRAIFVNVLAGSVEATTVADASQTKTSVTVEDGVAKSCEYNAGDRAYAILQPAGASPVEAEADATATIVVGP
jgi:hypothetical protein